MTNFSFQKKQATVLGLFDGEGELVIEKVDPPAVDEEVEIFAYNFSLSTGQPQGAIEIIIPYNDKGLSEEEEVLAVCGKYLNEETGDWENVHYTCRYENKMRCILSSTIFPLTAYSRLIIQTSAVLIFTM